MVNFVAKPRFYTIMLIISIFINNNLLAEDFVFILKDSSIISGSIISFENGIYKIKTKSLGEINVKADQIDKIMPLSGLIENNIKSYGKTSKIDHDSEIFQNKVSNSKSLGIIDEIDDKKYKEDIQPKNNNDNEKNVDFSKVSIRKIQSHINTLVKSLMADENFLEKALKIQSLPEFQEILNDPTIIEQIEQGNYEILMKNQKIIDLMNTNEMKEIIDMVK